MRHGRTSWNSERRFQGHTDVPLDEEGRAQALVLANTLREVRFERCVSSDLARARETARAICDATSTPLECDSRWREFDFGAWEGLTWEHIVERAPDLRDLPSTSVDRFMGAGGETYPQVRARVAEALAALKDTDGRILIVSHAGPLHAALDVLLGDGFMHVRLTPAGITRLEHVAGTWRLLALGQ